MTLVKDLKPSDTSKVENYYSNGAVKRQGTLYYYDMPEYTYSKRVGSWIEYYKDGVVKMESQYDNYGNLLSKSLYDKQGSISTEMVATLIDSKLSDSGDYFLKNDEVSIIFRIKNYKFGMEIGKMYLREAGLVNGGKRIGVWKIYKQSGSLEREIDYDNK